MFFLLAKCKILIVKKYTFGYLGFELVVLNMITSRTNYYYGQICLGPLTFIIMTGFKTLS